MFSTKLTDPCVTSRWWGGLKYTLFIKSFLPSFILLRVSGNVNISVLSSIQPRKFWQLLIVVRFIYQFNQNFNNFWWESWMEWCKVEEDIHIFYYWRYEDPKSLYCFSSITLYLVKKHHWKILLFHHVLRNMWIIQESYFLLHC